jgi:hypothetical protein
MHSSLVMALGRSDAGLERLSDYRASVVDRVRTFSRAQHVVSTIICWCFRASRVSGEFGARQDDCFAEQALQPGHDPYRHIGTLLRSSGVAVAERVFPVLWKAWYRNAGATSLSPVAAGNQGLPWVRRPLSFFANWPPSAISTEPVTQDASSEARHTRLPDGQISCAAYRPRVQPLLQKYFCFSEIKIKLYDSHPVPLRGALRNVNDAERDAVDAAARLTSDAASGRRRRVVLTPRRWRQVRERQLSRATVARKPGRRGEHEISRKPLRGECRVIPV